MTETPNRVPSLTKLGKLANGRKFDDLEVAWLLAVESGQYSAGDLVPIAGQVGRLGASDKAIGMIGILLSASEDKNGAAAALEAARLAARELPHIDDFRDDLLRLYAAVHTDYLAWDQLQAFVVADGDPLDVLVGTIDAYLPLRKGVYVRDTNYLPPGVIEEVKAGSGLIGVRFDKHRQEYGRDTLNKLTVLAADYFPALVIYDPEQLRELAESEPLGIVMLALKATKDRRLTYRELKQYVTTLLGEKGWLGWWKRTRLVLKRAPSIDVSSGSQPTLKLLNQARNYEERLRQEFDKQKDPLARLKMVLVYLEETRGNIVAGDEKAESAFTANEDLLIHFGNGAAKLAVARLADLPTVSLAGLATHAAVAACGVSVAKPNPNAAAKVLDSISDPSRLGSDLPDPLLLRTLEYLRVMLPERWPVIWAAVLIRASRKVCDIIARTLIKTNHQAELEATLRDILDRPTRSPEAVCWLWRAWHTASLGQPLAAMPSVSTATILTSLLSLIDASGKLIAVSNDDRHRRNLDMAQQVLMMGDGQPVRAVFAAVDREEASRFKTLIEKNGGLAASHRGHLLSLLRIEYGDLFIADDKPWEEEAVYTTELGLKKRQTELAEILEEQMPALAKQIGEAAAFGDLSENAEFTAALEKRDQLTSRATAMQNDLLGAKVITVEMAHSPYVNIGCRVVAKDLAAEQEETYTFLGPWDADADEHILTYNAPVSLAFMGKKVGDEVVYGDGDQQRRWEVLSIEPAI